MPRRIRASTPADAVRYWSFSAESGVRTPTREIFDSDARISFIVNRLKGTSKQGTLGLYVDIGTEGYFKDFRIIRSVNAAGAAAR